MKKFRVIRKDSGSKSGSREVSLIEALQISSLQSGSREIYLSRSFEALKSGSKFGSRGNLSPTNLLSCKYPVQNLGSRRIYLLQKVKCCRRGPVAMMHGSNMGIPPYWLIILLVTWGLQLTKRSSVH